jgi:hypothetical protein
MRSLAFLLVILVIACSPAKPADRSDAGAADGPLPPPEHGFQLVSPSVEVPPGGDLTYCYYFRTPNTSDLSIQRWVSHMTAGSQFMIVYLTSIDLQTPGSLSTSNCGINSNNGLAWTYAATSLDAETKLPADDGEGNAIGQPLARHQSGFIQMHYLNTTNAAISAHVELNAYAYADSASVISAGPFVTFGLPIDLPSGSATNPTTRTVNGTCNVPLTETGKVPKFFLLTTHTYKQGVHTFVKDGDTTLFDSTHWADPGATHWDTPPFYTFASGNLTYQCEYSNPNNYSIAVGDNAATDELCMAIGYYFPSLTGAGHFCLNSTLMY